MIQDFVNAWDANKSKLKEYIGTHNQSEYDEYEKLLKLLVKIVINPYLNEKNKLVLDIDHIHTIDDGEYQGSVMFFIPLDRYQPEPYQYVWTHQGYGSCSGCDTLMGISGYDSGLPSAKQVDEYMTLELHLLQKCRWLIGEDEHTHDPY